MSRQPLHGFLGIGAAFIVLGILAQPAFLGVGAGLFALGIAARRRPRH